jgi:hypothetical protein
MKTPKTGGRTKSPAARNSKATKPETYGKEAPIKEPKTKQQPDRYEVNPNMKNPNRSGAV